MSYLRINPSTGEATKCDALAWVYDPAPRMFACHSYRFEGEELIDGRKALGWIVKSASRAYRVYRLTYMVDTMELFCACEDCMFRRGSVAGKALWGTKAEFLQNLGPQVTRNDQGLCRHQRLVKELLIDLGRRLAEAFEETEAA